MVALSQRCRVAARSGWRRSHAQDAIGDRALPPRPGRGSPLASQDTTHDSAATSPHNAAEAANTYETPPTLSLSSARAARVSAPRDGACSRTCPKRASRCAFHPSSNESTTHESAPPDPPPDNKTRSVAPAKIDAAVELVLRRPSRGTNAQRPPVLATR